MSEVNETLEAAIDRAGRDRVFSRARALGWADGGAPEWVWFGIVNEIESGEPLHVPIRESPPSLFEGIFGFRLY